MPMLSAERRQAPRGPGLAALLLRLDPPDATNVRPIRADCALTPASPEAALIAWRLALSADEDPSEAARALLACIDRGAANSAPRARLCAYLRDVVAAARRR